MISLKLKFAGVYKNFTGTHLKFKGVVFKNGETVLSGKPEHVSALAGYLRYFQALPVDEAIALQAKLDAATSKDVPALLKQAEAAEAAADKARELLAAGVKGQHDGEVQDSTAPTGRKSGETTGDKDPKQSHKAGK